MLQLHKEACQDPVSRDLEDMQRHREPDGWQTGMLESNPASFCTSGLLTQNSLAYS